MTRTNQQPYRTLSDKPAADAENQRANSLKSLERVKRSDINFSFDFS
jgi:hypothetical protein